MASFVVDPQLMAYRLAQFSHGYIKRLFITLPSKFVSSETRMKPPNVLVFKSCMTNVVDEDTIRAVENCLPINKYVVYRLSHVDAVKDPWMENCQLLIIPNFSVHKKEDNVEKSTKANLETEISLCKEYLSNGGIILNFSYEFMECFGYHPCEPCTEDDNADNMNEHTMLCTAAGGKILHSTLPLISNNIVDTRLLRTLLVQIQFADEDELDSSLQVQKETPCFLLSRKVSLLKKFLSDLRLCESKLEEVSVADKTLCFLQLSDFGSNSKPIIELTTPRQVLVLYCLREGVLAPVKFDWDEFTGYLQSKSFGRVLIYADVVTSTMDIVEPLVGRIRSYDTSITCVARQQSQGKGRGNNKWLSPVGTAMFSLVFSIPITSRLGRHLPVLQHLTTVAVVHSVRSIPGLENLDLRVKWPNDIYIGKTTKIGGVLVKSTALNQSFILTIGCGVNVSNKQPTRCINDLIKFANPDHGLLSQEKFLSLTLSSLETLIERYQENGDKEFLSLYYKYWIHENQEVKVKCTANDLDGDGTVRNATIIGIDGSGFLKVKTVESEEISLQPDGNSFDMIKNLIAMKKS